jgi:hypothetical protein
VSDLQDLQQSFLAHLLGTPSRVVESIESTADTSAQQRLDIYASGYRARLKEAISTDYERLHQYLGDEQFEQLMDRYIDIYNSSHPSLRYYSQHMIELLTSEKPYTEIPVLTEIANIEQSFNDSFDAANCTTVDIAELAQVRADDWPVLKFEFHTSLRVLSFEYNSFPIWKELSEEQTPPELVNDASTWVVWRKELVSRYRTLESAEARALELALAGANFSEICEELLDFFDEQTTPSKAITFLQSWINEKMVCQLTL